MLFTRFVFEDGLFRKLSINPEHVRKYRKNIAKVLILQKYGKKLAFDFFNLLHLGKTHRKICCTKNLYNK